jgi:hypothetical protein
LNEAKAAEYAAEFYGGIPGARELLLASADSNRHREERDRAWFALNILDTSNPLPDRDSFAALLDEARPWACEEEFVCEDQQEGDIFGDDSSLILAELKVARRVR